MTTPPPGGQPGEPGGPPLPPLRPRYNLALYLAGLLLVMAGLGGVVAASCGAHAFRDAWLLLVPGVAGIGWSIKRSLDVRRAWIAVLRGLPPDRS